MIRITKQADYGILLLSHFARMREGRTSTARDLALDTGLGPAMVTKILKMLVHRGLLVSHRGAKGGYALARAPSEVTIGEIIAALEGPVAITSCTTPPVGGCSILARCTVKGSWRRINDALREALDRVTLADMTCPVADPVHPFRHEEPAAQPV
jgi:FeS assembly SUF system regulator